MTRIGIDWGGTKIELAALDADGTILLRQRIATPRDDYEQSIQAVCDLVSNAEKSLGVKGTVGVGIPGTISTASGLVKNANSTWLNGKPLKADLEARLGRAVRVQNDANCFAVSEAVDGAGQGHRVVAGVIIGTGCGCGIAIDGKAHVGRNAIAGEFGHTPLPWPTKDEYPGDLCWCGRRGCLETWISGSGFERHFNRHAAAAKPLSAEEIMELSTQESAAAMLSYCDRLARGLSVLVNMVDPDVVVLGGGMSNVSTLYEVVPGMMEEYVFSDVFETPIVPAQHGDSSGVRGAAWLW